MEQIKLAQAAMDLFRECKILKDEEIMKLTYEVLNYQANIA